MSNDKKYAVIVDPLSAGKEYIKALLIKGIFPILVFSLEAKESVFYGSFQNENHILIEADCVDKIILEIKSYVAQNKIIFCVPGTETGVFLADQISNHFSLPCNKISLSTERRNKYRMQECLKSAKIKSISHVRINSVDELIFHDFTYPVIVKPAMSAGSDGVTFCETKEQLQKVAQKLFHKRNQLGGINTELVVQEYLCGTEYVVDFVSHNGKHHLVAMWKYKKIENEKSRFIYDSLTLVTQTDINFDKLVQYTEECLDALGIVHGPSHNEIMLVEGSPVLIESGARPHGGKSQTLMSHCFGYNQISVWISLILNESISLSYQYLNYAALAFLISDKEGIFKHFGCQKEIEKLSSYIDFFPFIKENDMLECTKDLLNIPGIVLFAHKKKENVESDLIQLRILEKLDVFYNAFYKNLMVSGA